MRTVFFHIGLMFLAALTAVAELASAQDVACTSYFQFAEYGTHVRYNNINYFVVITLSDPNELAQIWSKAASPGMPGGGPRCICTDDHKSSKNHGYEHVHYRNSIPAAENGSVQGTVTPELDANHPKTIDVTREMIEAFYDWEYLDEGFTRVAGTGWDNSMNCHGFSMGLETWVNNSHILDTIIPDDWTGSVAPATNCTMGIAKPGVDHSFKLVFETFGTPAVPKCVRVDEKFRDSPIYFKTGTGLQPAAPKRGLSFVHGTNDRIPGPWDGATRYAPNGATAPGGGTGGGGTGGGGTGGGGTGGGGTGGGGTGGCP